MKQIKITIQDNNSIELSFTGLNRASCLLVLGDIILQHAIAQAKEMEAIKPANVNDLNKLDILNRRKIQ